MEIELLGHTIPIAFHEGVIDPMDIGMSAEEGSQLFGVYLPLKTEIHISNMPLNQQKSTVIHELLEAINSLLELEMEHPQISGLETALFQLLTQNPPLLKYLGSQRKGKK